MKKSFPSHTPPTPPPCYPARPHLCDCMTNGRLDLRVIAVNFRSGDTSVPSSPRRTPRSSAVRPLRHLSSLSLHPLCFCFIVCLFGSSFFFWKEKKQNKQTKDQSSQFSLEYLCCATDLPSASLCPVSVATFPSFYFSLVYFSRRRPF